MDGRGARILAARILAGARPGDRVEVLACVAERSELARGDQGVVTCVDEGVVRVAWDSGLESDVDPGEAGLSLHVHRR
jgi:hypothetical protein